MAIFAIARELAACGEEVAEELTKLTGYRTVDRSRLEARLAASGINEDKRKKYDEKRPGLWASLSQERDDYLHYLKTAIFEEAAEGACVIVGRGATALLKELPNVVSVRVVAPRALRMERVMAQFGCNEKRAHQLLEQSDHDRAGFQKYFFSLDWRDPAEYSLSISMSGRPSPAEAAALIEDYRRLVVTEAEEKAGTKRMGELLLGQRVVTEIVYGKRIPLHFLEAEVQGGKVLLHGVSNTQAAIEAAIAAAKTLPGVGEVSSAIQVVQEFTVMP